MKHVSITVLCLALAACDGPSIGPIDFSGDDLHFVLADPGGAIRWPGRTARAARR